MSGGHGAPIGAKADQEGGVTVALPAQMPEIQLAARAHLGRLRVAEVLTFSTVTIVAGLAYLALAVNPLTATLGLLTWVLYVWIYTPLKTRTSGNTAAVTT